MESNCLKATDLVKRKKNTIFHTEEKNQVWRITAPSKGHMQINRTDQTPNITNKGLVSQFVWEQVSSNVNAC